MVPTDDHKEISRLNALDINDLVVTWKAWKDEHTIRGDRGGPVNNPPMVKSVSLKFWSSNLFGSVQKTYFILM